jgi:hypothetical protein
MAQTVATFTDVLKEVWTSDRLEKQFYSETPFLDRIERTNKYTIGKQAQVPLHVGRSGGESTRPAAGGALNTADRQRVDTAVYTIPQHWFQVDIQAATMAQGPGGNASVVDSVDLEIDGAMSDMRKSLMRQVLGGGDALIAQTTTTSNSTVVLLTPQGTTGAAGVVPYGYDAIAAGHLRVGQYVDIGTTGNETSAGADLLISAVSESSSTPSITVQTAITTTTLGYVSIRDNRSGTTAYETNGLRSIAGSTTSALGGLDPDTAGEEFWKPASVSTTSSISLDELLTLQRGVFKKTGKNSTYILTSPKQLSNIYSFLQSQVRFVPDKVTAGNVESTTWNGNEIVALPDVYDNELYMLTLEDLLVISDARWGKPTWASDIEGRGGRFHWNVGQTNFVDGLVYFFNIGARRRNGFAANVSLHA